MKGNSRGFAPPKVTECSFILKLLFLIMCMYVYPCVVGMRASMQVNEEARGIVSTHLAQFLTAESSFQSLISF